MKLFVSKQLFVLQQNCLYQCVHHIVRIIKMLNCATANLCMQLYQRLLWMFLSQLALTTRKKILQLSGERVSSVLRFTHALTSHLVWDVVQGVELLLSSQDSTWSTRYTMKRLLVDHMVSPYHVVWSSSVIMLGAAVSTHNMNQPNLHGDLFDHPTW